MSRIVVKISEQDHGIMNSQYFQGCSAMFTEYDECDTGCGDNPHEAFEDALEMIASGDGNVDFIENNKPKTPSVVAREDEHRNQEWQQALDQYLGENPDHTQEDFEAQYEEDYDDYDTNYYLSILWSGFEDRFDPAWNTSAVCGLISAIEAGSAYDRFPVLADALEESGCDSDVLDYLRDANLEDEESARVLKWLVSKTAVLV